MTTAHKANSGEDSQTPVTVILKTSEPDVVYVPYWQSEDEFEQARR